MKRAVVMRSPVWLAQAMYRVAFGWVVSGVSWNRLPDGRFDVVLSMRRQSRYAVLYDSESFQWRKMPVYDRMTLWQRVRLGWLLLWSKEVSE